MNKTLPSSSFKRLHQLNEYAHSTVLAKLEKQRELKVFGEQCVCLFSDIDNTYIHIEPMVTPDKQELHLFNKISRTSTDALTKWLDEHSVPIIGVTGRDLENVQIGQQGGTSYEIEHLPFFDIVAASIGTELWIRQEDGTYTRDLEFSLKVDQEIGFRREVVYPLCVELVKQFNKRNESTLSFQFRDSEKNVSAYGHDREALKHGLTKELYPQRTKISLVYWGDAQGIKKAVTLIKEVLHKNNLSQVRVIVSYNTHALGDVSYNIDIVPVTKRQSIDFLSDKLGCLAVCGGDSGNDIDSILFAGFAGFAVSGRTRELEEFLSKHVVGYDTNITGFQKVQVQQVDEKDRLLYIDEDEESRGPVSVLNAMKRFEEYLKL